MWQVSYTSCRWKNNRALSTIVLITSPIDSRYQNTMLVKTSEIDLLRDVSSGYRDGKLAFTPLDRRARLSAIISNRRFTSRLLAPNHGERLDEEGEFAPAITLDFIPSSRCDFDSGSLFVSPPPRATRPRTKDAFLPRLHQIAATGAAARPQGRKSKITKERKRERDYFFAVLINCFCQRIEWNDFCDIIL